MARMDDWGGTALYSLEITRPVAANHANDRWKHAYPGLPYVVRVAAVGGVYPYLYELIGSGNPGDMVIDEETGVITWANPQSNATGCQVRVTDTKGTSVDSATWNITVATTRFKFVDASATDDSGTGAIGSPWKTLGKFQADGTATTLGYFRTGTYNIYAGSGVAVDESDATRWGAAQDRPAIFLAYPGESPVIDHGYVAGVTEGLMFDFGNSSTTTWVYLDGIEHTHAHNKCLRVVPTNNSYGVVRNFYFHHNGPGQGGSNSALGIDFESGNYTSGDTDNFVIQDGEASHYVNNAVNCFVKLYSTDKLLIEDVYLHDLDISGDDEEAIANKAGNRQVTIRNCRSENMDQGSFGGNQNGGNANGYQCDHELAFNNFSCTGNRVVNMNHDNNSNAASRLHRNTFKGTVRYVFCGASGGPWAWDRNVIVNGNAASDNPNGSGITHVNSPTISRITVTNPLFGPNDGSIIDSNGLLVDRELVGQYGHEIPESEEAEGGGSGQLQFVRAGGYL